MKVPGGKGAKVSVPCIYNNEMEGGDMVEELCAPVCDSRIIALFI